MFRILWIAVCLSATLYGNTVNPPLARTGAPTESTCAACHIGTAQSGAAVMEFGTLSYTPGVKQTIRVHVFSANFVYTGMEITARLGSNELQQAGHFEAGEFTRLRIENNLEYVSQNVQTGTTVFTINWTPPATNVGNIRFYATGVTGLGNSTAEPNAYAASYTMPPSSGREVSRGYRCQSISIPSLTNPSVTAISSDGKMTGTYLLPVRNITGGFVRDTNGTVTTFAPPLTNDGIVPQAINSSGKVVGYYYDKTGPTIVQRGFIRDSNGTFTTFSAPGAETGQLLAINDAGLITGLTNNVAIQLTTPPSFSLPDPASSGLITSAVNNVETLCSLAGMAETRSP